MNQEACEAGVASAENNELAKLEEGAGQRTAPEVPGEDEFKIRVLLVEDEALIAEIIGEVLSDAGHEVHAVSNAADALSHLSSGSRVDILFTDINLPGTMDGAELAASARQSHPKLSVIYASGRWGLLDKLRGTPNAAILQKPYSPARACETVDRLIAARLESGTLRSSKRSEGLELAL